MGIEIGIGSAAKETPLAVGIDLGTTNSLVAYVKDGRPVVIPGPNGSGLVPSVVSFQPDNLFVGAAAKKYQLTDSSHTVYSIKRLMGKGIDDVAAELPLLPYRISGHGKEIVKVEVQGR